MATRVGLSGKGMATGAVGAMALMTGTGLQIPLLNLCGYFFLVALAMALVLSFLETRGIRIQAAAGWPDPTTGERPVWVRLPTKRRAGPFGLALRTGKRWLPDRPLFAPEPAGVRLVLPATAPPGAVKVRLRSFPLGLIWIGLVVTAETLPEPGENPSETPVIRPSFEAFEPFGGVREHRPGETVRDVHWGASARRGKLLVRIREPEPDAEPRPRFRSPEATEAVPERCDMVHLATAVTGAGAIAFAWAVGTISAPIGVAASVLQAIGAWVSFRRMGRPGWPLLVLLYLGILCALGWFLLSLRNWQTATTSTAVLLTAVVAIFAWDLRNRVYLRAQQLNAFVLMGFASAIVPIRDTPLLGLLFAVTAGALMLASWADGRHEVGSAHVTFRDLQDLPSAWLPIGVIGLVVLLAQPWFPALPLPPLPTFGLVSPNFTARLKSSNLPGHEGNVTLNARWHVSETLVAQVSPARPMRLRAEVFQTYKAGQWFRTDRSDRKWPDPSLGRQDVTIWLAEPGMTILPVPEGTVRVEAPPPMRGYLAGGVIETSFPTRRGFTYHVSYATDDLEARPASFMTRSTADIDPRLLGYARHWAGAETDPGLALVRICSELTKRKDYDLEAPVAPPGVDPTVYFLERSPSGFCIHFATALALMGRELGIPTRLVTGYAPAAGNAEVMDVREADAHAWVEAYVKGRWRVFDPTPPRRAKADLSAPWRVTGLVLLSIGVGGFFWWRRPRIPATTRAYLRALRRLRQHGITAGAHEAPRELLERSRATLPDAEWQEFRDLTLRYEAARFG